jgi:HAE1 family hydrophobic/amphiphilic exporter-1
MRRAVLVALAAASLALFGGPIPAPAQTLTLTLDMAISLGVENSPDLRAARLNLLSSQKDVKAARAARYPGLTLGSGYSRQFDTAAGGTLSSPPDLLDVSLGLSQPLVTFGRLGSAVKEAVAGSDIAKLDADETQRSLTIEIQRQFYGYLLSREILSVKKETLARREEALEVARERFGAGLCTKRDVLKAESDLKGFIPELLAAQNDNDYALLSLKNIVGIEAADDVEVVGELDVPSVSPERETIILEALAKNGDIKRQELSIAVGKAQERLAKSEKLPAVSGFVNVGLQNGFDLGAAGYRGTGWESAFSAGVSAQFGLDSLFPWSAKTAQVEKSAIDLKKMDEELSSKRDTVSLGVERVLLDLSKAKAQIDAGEKALELAEELYLASKEMYENGLVTITEYDDAQISLSDSRVGYLTYIYDYRMALYDLMDAIGTDVL